VPTNAPSKAGSGRGSRWGSRPTRRAAQGTESPPGTSDTRRTTSREAKEPKAPHAPAGRGEASPERASVAAGAKPPPLDTLAQPCQSPPDGREKLKKRARAKHFTVPLVIGLAELRSPLEKSYRNAYYCADKLHQDEAGVLRGKYCGTRWCLVCNRVRIARAVNRYHPVLGTWPTPRFVTLTIPNVPGSALRDTISEMLRGLAALNRAIRRTDGLPFRGLRKLECTYNPVRGDFHPHFHLVVDGQEQAEALVQRWLDAYPDASREAQDIRPCDTSTLLELFKYFTKLVTRSAGADRLPIPVAQLDIIFQAMKGRRVFQPMGFKSPCHPDADENAQIGESADTSSPSRIGEQVTWTWEQALHDWVDLTSGEALTGYRPRS